MSTMQAWCFKQYGAPSALELQTHERPRSGPGEVLVKVLAAGINPSDVKNISGHFKSTLPRVPGRDFAGVIVGGDRDGEEVWGSAPGFGVTRDGSHQQYLVLPSAWVSRKPKALGMEQAAAIGVPWLAAWTSLVTIGRLQEGETLLITGVSGSVGSAATQIAHQRKARVIGVDRSSANPSGADALIDTTGGVDLADEARGLTDGQGVDMVLDAVGGRLFEACLKALHKGGRQVAMASTPQVVNFNLVDFYHNTSRLFGMDTMALTGPEVAAILDGLAPGFESGAYRAPSVQTWPFAQAIGAYEAVTKPGLGVKHVLVAT